MKKTSIFTKITATAMAAIMALLACCITSFAAESRGGADLYIGSEVAHFDDISEAWNTALSSKKEARIVLQQDWIADENGSFGTGEYFPNGAIGILSKHQDFTLDLNGYKIDRGLQSKKNNGCVFDVDNCTGVTITDSSEAQTSVITGGFNENKGGAFSVIGSTLTVSNIKIQGNKTTSKGGAFWIEKLEFEDETVRSIVTLDNCTVTQNQAKTGGAVYIETSNRIRIYDTTITNNSADADGGIHTEVFGFVRANITLGGKVIIADNETKSDGTGLMLDESFFTKVVIDYSSARPLAQDSRIVILSKTGDKTLRITEDSENTNIGCFEYENDKYEIIEKGSGNEQYLDIKKV